MKRKRKRSTSSSSSSSSRKSSTSSSSSRRRAKKKKKKKRKSARGSKRRSGRRRSDEGKRGRKRKENEEDEEAEWYPAPPDTSATFLDQKTWEAFGAAADEEEGEPSAKPKDANGPRICLYSLSPSSDDDDDVCEWPSHPARETKESPERSRKSRSTSSGREDGRPRSSERGMGDQRRTAEPQRSSLDERKRRVSCSSSDSAYSRKLGPGKDFSRRNFSLRGGEDQTPSESDLGQGKAAKQQPGWSQSDAARIQAEEDEEISLPEGRSKEDLPANLLDIFQQIAKFQKEKGIEPKKSTNSI